MIIDALNLRLWDVEQSLTATNVKLFGARGDNTTNDTASFRKALEAGGPIYVPGGRYKLEKLSHEGGEVSLTLAPDAILDFSGISSGGQNENNCLYFSGSETSSVNLTANASALDTSVSVEAGKEGFVSPGEWVRIGSNAKFNPSTEAGTLGYKIGEIAQVKAVSSGKIELSNGLVAGQYATADEARVSKITFAPAITITGGRIIGPGIGHEATAFCFDKCTKVRVNNVRFEYFDYKFVDIVDSTDVVVDEIDIFGGTSESTGFYGVSFTNATQECSFVNSRVNGCRHGTTTDWGFGGGTTGRVGLNRRCSVIGNKFLNSLAASIDTHGCTEDMTVIGNTILNPVGAGIQARCPHLVATGNTIRNPGDKGIWLRNQSFHASAYLIADNRIIGGTSYGIYYSNPPETAFIETNAGEASAGVEIVNNSLYDVNGSEGIGIYIFSSATFPLSNVTIKGNSLNGSMVRLENTQEILSDNHIFNLPNSRAAAVRVLASTDIDIADKITCTGEPEMSAIRIQTTSTRVSVQGARVRNASTGARFENTVTNSTIQGSDFKTCSTATVKGSGEGNIVQNNRE